MAFVDHTYNQYINAYRINFRNWKIVDVDNYMDGNHFFSELKEEQVWNKKVNDLLGGGKVELWGGDQSKNLLFEREVKIPALQEVVD